MAPAALPRGLPHRPLRPGRRHVLVPLPFPAEIPPGLEYLSSYPRIRSLAAAFVPKPSRHVFVHLPPPDSSPRRRSCCWFESWRRERLVQSGDCDCERHGGLLPLACHPLPPAAQRQDLPLSPSRPSPLPARCARVTPRRRRPALLPSPTHRLPPRLSPQWIHPMKQPSKW